MADMLRFLTLSLGRILHRGALLSFLVVLAIGACSSATAPKGIDPTVLVVNHMPPGQGPDTVYLTWFDQSGQVATTAIPPTTTQCVHFTATLLADSVRFHVAATNSIGTSTQDSPWFLAGQANMTRFGSPLFEPEFWSLTVTNTTSSPEILMKSDSLTAPC